MRYFFSTGESSGELSATLLAAAIAKLDPDAQFSGIGAIRMAESGFTVVSRSDGWSSMGPISAISKIPKLLLVFWRILLHLLRERPDLIVLVDFGAFNLRLARSLRRFGYRRPILYFFPPGAWLDRPKQARAVSLYTAPLTPFAHQRDFYRSAGLPIAYFGHPLVGEYIARPARPAAPPDGGTVGLLPGSRGGELRYHIPALLDAFALLKAQRCALRGILGAADAPAERMAQGEILARNLSDICVVRSARAALEGADAAWIASGTAVLEAALSGVPSIALYILSRAQAKIARRVYHGSAITIPNLVLGRRVLPELLQENATPSELAREMDELLADPGAQYRRLLDLRRALGPGDALAQAAGYAFELAKS
ncbi:MAG: hypothetical protein ABI182_00615 [Candidatus Baltobacteraceae bacterium]